MIKVRLKLRKVVAIAICLIGVTMFSSCEKTPKDDDAVNSGWIKYDGKTYNLTNAYAEAFIDSYDGSQYGVYIVLRNSTATESFSFSVYSESNSPRTGTYNVNPLNEDLSDDVMTIMAVIEGVLVTNGLNSGSVTISKEGNYEFKVDVVCTDGKPLSAYYKGALQSFSK